MPSQSSGRLLRLGRRPIMQVHEPPLTVALKPDIGFLKVLLTHGTFNGAGFDAQQVTRDWLSPLGSIRACVSDNGTDSTPRPLLTKQSTFSPIAADLLLQVQDFLSGLRGLRNARQDQG